MMSSQREVSRCTAAMGGVAPLGGSGYRRTQKTWRLPASYPSRVECAAMAQDRLGTVLTEKRAPDVPDSRHAREQGSSGN